MSILWLGYSISFNVEYVMPFRPQVIVLETNESNGEGSMVFATRDEAMDYGKLRIIMGRVTNLVRAGAVMTDLYPTHRFDAKTCSVTELPRATEDVVYLELDELMPSVQSDPYRWE